MQHLIDRAKEIGMKEKTAIMRRLQRQDEETLRHLSFNTASLFAQTVNTDQEVDIAALALAILDALLNGIEESA